MDKNYQINVVVSGWIDGSGWAYHRELIESATLTEEQARDAIAYAKKRRALAMSDFTAGAIADANMECNDTLFEVEVVAWEKESRKVLYICKMWSSEYKKIMND